MPIASTRSASSHSAPASGTCGGRPTRHGWSRRQQPARRVGLEDRRAQPLRPARRRPRPRRAASAPPPAQTSGRRAAPASSPARADEVRSGAPGQRPGRPGGSAARRRPRRRAGRSGPRGRRAARAPRSPRRRALARPSRAERSASLAPGSVALVTGANIARWSGASCSSAAPHALAAQRRRARRWRSRRTGEREANASPTAPSVFAAPGPVVTSATPTPPLARA